MRVNRKVMTLVDKLRTLINSTPEVTEEEKNRTMEPHQKWLMDNVLELRDLPRYSTPVDSADEADECYQNWLSDLARLPVTPMTYDTWKKIKTVSATVMDTLSIVTETSHGRKRETKVRPPVATAKAREAQTACFKLCQDAERTAVRRLDVNKAAQVLAQSLTDEEMDKMLFLLLFNSQDGAPLVENVRNLLFWLRQSGRNFSNLCFPDGDEAHEHSVLTYSSFGTITGHETGGNGKTTIVESIASLIARLTDEPTRNTFSEPRFISPIFSTSMLVVDSEFKLGDANGMRGLQQITSGVTYQSERKGVDTVTLRPNALLLAATNTNLARISNAALASRFKTITTDERLDLRGKGEELQEKFYDYLPYCPNADDAQYLFGGAFLALLGLTQDEKRFEAFSTRILNRVIAAKNGQLDTDDDSNDILREVHELEKISAKYRMSLRGLRVTLDELMEDWNHEKDRARCLTRPKVYAQRKGGCIERLFERERINMTSRKLACLVNDLAPVDQRRSVKLPTECGKSPEVVEDYDPQPLDAHHASDRGITLDRQTEEILFRKISVIGEARDLRDDDQCIARVWKALVGGAAPFGDDTPETPQPTKPTEPTKPTMPTTPTTPTTPTPPEPVKPSEPAVLPTPSAHTPESIRALADVVRNAIRAVQEKQAEVKEALTDVTDAEAEQATQKEVKECSDTPTTGHDVELSMATAGGIRCTRLQKVSFDALMTPESVEELAAEEKTDCRLISWGYDPAKEAVDRKEANLPCVETVLLDYDNEDEDAELMAKTEQDLQKRGLGYTVYESFSSTPERPKFRVLIKLDRPLTVGESHKAYKTVLARLFPGSDTHASWFFLPAKSKVDTLRTQPGSCLSADYVEALTKEEAALQERKRQQDARQFERLSAILPKGEGKAANASAVRAYLTTSYPARKGNGSLSQNGLLRAIGLCKACNDEATLRQVLDKARTEGWTEQELMHKVEDARG